MFVQSEIGISGTYICNKYYKTASMIFTTKEVITVVIIGLRYVRICQRGVAEAGDSVFPKRFHSYGEACGVFEIGIF